MKLLLLIFPVALMVTCSQIAVKWRADYLNIEGGSSILERLWVFLTDPIILIAYIVALVGSFAWLYVVTKFPLTIAFPVYIGMTFVLVLLGGAFFLGEHINLQKIAAILLISVGIVVGVLTD